MKKIALSVALFAAATSAFAYDEASQTLQWSGEVPAASQATDSGYVITKVGTTEFNAGQLTFTNEAGVIALQSASTIGFKILKDTDLNGVADGHDADDVVNTTESALTYSMKLTNVKVDVNGNGFNEQVDGFFTVVEATEGELAKETVLPTQSETVVTIGTKAGVASTLVASDKVSVQAVLAVTPDAV